MNINATVKSVTGKVVVIAYRDNPRNEPRVVEVKTPIALKSWEVEEWIATVEIRPAYHGHKWGLKDKRT